MSQTVGNNNATTTNEMIRRHSLQTKQEIWRVLTNYEPTPIVFSRVSRRWRTKVVFCFIHVFDPRNGQWTWIKSGQLGYPKQTTRLASFENYLTGWL